MRDIKSIECIYTCNNVSSFGHINLPVLAIIVLTKTRELQNIICVTFSREFQAYAVDIFSCSSIKSSNELPKTQTKTLSQTRKWPEVFHTCYQSLLTSERLHSRPQSPSRPLAGGVTVIWVSPCFGHPRTQIPSDITGDQSVL